MNQRKRSAVVILAASCLTLGLVGCSAPREAPGSSGWAVPAEQPSVGSVTVAGQPSADGLRTFAADGGASVVVFRTQREMDRLAFDQADLAADLGLRYELVETRSSTIGDAEADAIQRAIQALPSGGKLLLHCGSGGRAAGALAAYRVRHEDVGFATAIAEAETLVGLSSATIIDRVRLLAMGDAPALAARLASGVEPGRMLVDVEALAGFGTRHTLSGETEGDGRGIDDATAWLQEQFYLIGVRGTREGDMRFIVELDAHRVAPDGRRIMQEAEVVNVVCTIPGTDDGPRRGVYYVLAHLDSRASDVMDAETDAPGANDDASGVAALLEIARALASEPLDATVVLLATSGEEQGLIGARRHASLIRAAGRNVHGVLSNDTIGDPTGPDGRIARDEVRVFSEGIPASLVVRGQQGGNGMRGVDIMRRLSAENDGASRHLARFLAEVAWWHDLPVKPKLIHRPDRFLRGGDHTAFNEAGYPAVRLIEVYEDYTRQHQDVRTEDGVDYGDVAEHVDAAYLADVTRLNIATLVHLANAPVPPTNARIIAAELTNDTTLRWNKSPGAAGYEVLWRETTSSEWSRFEDVGDVAEATFDLSKDNWFFGVRAYDEEGYRSPVVFPIAARE